MRVSADQIPKTIHFLQFDLPELVLATAQVEDAQEYWDDVIQRVNEISKKYGTDNGFVNKMLLAYTDYLDESYRKMRKLKEENT